MQQKFTIADLNSALEHLKSMGAPPSAIEYPAIRLLDFMEEKMTTNVDKYFVFEHLPPKLQAISKPIAELALVMDSELPDGAEKSAGMRKLLEAKDCFVRAALDK